MTLQHLFAAVVILLLIPSVWAAWSDSGSYTYISDGDDVGIGTTTPQQSLEVLGTQRISRNTNGRLIEFFHTGVEQGRITLNNGPGMDISFLASNNLILRTNSSTALTILPDGKVGVGTTVPEGALHIAGRSDGDQPIKGVIAGMSGDDMEFASIELKGDQVGGGGFVDFGYLNDDQEGRILYNNNNDLMNFYANQQIILSVLPTGIGVDDQTPEELFEVVGGNIKATGGLVIESRTDVPASPDAGQIWLRTSLI